VFRRRRVIVVAFIGARAEATCRETIPDRSAARIAKNGGVVQINFYSLFVDQKNVARK